MGLVWEGWGSAGHYRGLQALLECLCICSGVWASPEGALAKFWGAAGGM